MRNSGFRQKVTLNDCKSIYVYRDGFVPLFEPRLNVAAAYTASDERKNPAQISAGSNICTVVVVGYEYKRSLLHNGAIWIIFTLE